MPDASHQPVSPDHADRKSFGLWLETASDGVLAAVATPFFFVLAEVLQWAAGKPLPFIPRGPLGIVAIAAISIAIGAAFPRVRNAQQAARPLGRVTIDVWKAAATGRLPHDADPAVWRPVVVFYASQFYGAQKNLPKVFMGLALCVVGGFFISALFGALMIALFVVLSVAILSKRRSLPPRLDALFAQLGALEERRAPQVD